MNISKYLTLAEAIKSPTAIRLGIENIPNDQELENIKYVASNVFDKVRDHVNGPLHSSSFFRCKKLNDATPGSSKSSQHMTGEAIDIDCDTFNFGNNNEIYDWISKTLDFDQIIGEYPSEDGKFSWVHVSLKKDNNRRERLVKIKDKYVHFPDWKAGMI